MYSYSWIAFNQNILCDLKKDYKKQYLKIKNIKYNFFTQHNLWKYKKMLTRLFEKTNSIKSAETFILKLIFLEILLNIKEYKDN